MRSIVNYSPIHTYYEYLYFLFSIMRFPLSLLLLVVLSFPWFLFASSTGDLLTGTVSSGNTASFVNASDTSFSKLDDLIPKVFQLNVYKYDQVFDRYSLIQYGSAVLIDTDKIITNAHVVYNADSKDTYLYQVCKTSSIKNKPTCFSSAKLVRIDTTNDLALLTITTADNLWSPVSLSSSDQSIWSTIHVLGYPANGWETITATKWTIAWYEKNYYKIDANLDEWNSGWWAFDDNGNLVWIPSFLANGYSSLGYILDVKIVRSFLDWTLGKLVNLPISSGFVNHLSGITLLNNQWYIQNKFFTTPSFSDYNFTLTNVVEKWPQNMYYYTLYSSDGNLMISIQSVLRSTKTNPKEYTHYSADYYKQSGYKSTTTSKTLSWSKWQVIIASNNDTSLYTYIQDSAQSNVFLEVNIQANSDADTQTIRNALWFVESISLSKLPLKNPSVVTPQFQFAGQQYSLFKTLSDDSVNVFFVPQNQSFYGLLNYSDLWLNPSKWILSGMVTLFSNSTDGTSSLQYSTQNMPFYTITYNDDLNISHLLGLRLVKEKNKYYSITADVLLTAKNTLADAKKALKSFKVSSFIK